MFDEKEDLNIVTEKFLKRLNKTIQKFCMWLHEVINSLYEAGLQNDKLPLLFLENNNAQVAIKSNGRISKRVNIKNIIMQGSVRGSLCCVVLMDKLGKLVYSNKDLLYY